MPKRKVKSVPDMKNWVVVCHNTRNGESLALVTRSKSAAGAKTKAKNMLDTKTIIQFVFAGDQSPTLLGKNSKYVVSSEVLFELAKK